MSMSIDEARAGIGRRVIYRPRGWVGTAPAEEGTIRAISEASTYVFVLYAGDQHAKATSPEDLSFIVPGPPRAVSQEGIKDA